MFPIFRTARHQGALRPLKIYSTAFCYCWLLIAIRCACAERRTGNDDTRAESAPEAQCGTTSGTYYIHEYHVHADGDTVTGSPKFVQPFSKPERDGMHSGSYNMTKYLEEKATWLERFRDLTDRLADERVRRFDILANLVAWLGAAEGSHPERTSVESLKNMLVVWSQTEGFNYSRIPPDEQTLKNLTSEQLGQVTEAELTAATCNLTLINDLNKVVRHQKAELSDAKKEIQKLNKRYLTTYTGYKKMVANVRELKRDLRSWEHRAGRLLRMYESQFELTDKRPKDGALKPDESNNLLDDVKALKRRVWCLERGETDPLLCPNIKSPKRVKPSKETPANDEHIGDEKGRVRTVDSLMAGNMSRILQDTFVDAGKELSEWHQDKLLQQKPKDCSEIDYWFQRREPVQVVYLDGGRRPVKVLCDEGWTVIMRNIPYGDSPLDWQEGEDRLWEHYKYGFGTFESDLFWLGNDYVYRLTNQADYQLRMDMVQTADDVKVFAEYAFFRVAAEDDGYRLAVGDNMGTAGDVLGVHSPVPVDRQQFLTLDRHPDMMDNRLKFYREGWWYPTVEIRHDPEGQPEPCFTHLTYQYPWICGRDGYQQLSAVTMKVRPLRDGL